MTGERMGVEDRNLRGIERLPTPEELKREHPLTPEAERTVRRAREAIRRALRRRDKRQVVVVGPCSLHDPASAREYAARLAPLARELEGELIIVMRTYFEKPRTTVGWKGLVNDPLLDGSCRVGEGLGLARQLLVDINTMGLACATEFLDPITPQYLADAVAWAAIGARTTESQTHREMASGLSMPVGFKNGTDGGIRVARDAMLASASPHAFLGIRADGIPGVVKTAGNPDTHLVLRGGRGTTNYDAESVAMASRDLDRRGILIDCSHGNSEKDYTRQSIVLRDVARQLREGAATILGVMLESHLEEGSQAFSPGETMRYGVSMTDACIGFEETDGLLRELAAAVKASRRMRRAVASARPNAA